MASYLPGSVLTWTTQLILATRTLRALKVTWEFMYGTGDEWEFFYVDLYSCGDEACHREGWDGEFVTGLCEEEGGCFSSAESAWVYLPEVRARMCLIPIPIVTTHRQTRTRSGQAKEVSNGVLCFPILEMPRGTSGLAPESCRFASMSRGTSPDSQSDTVSGRRGVHSHLDSRTRRYAVLSSPSEVVPLSMPQPVVTSVEPNTAG